MAHSFNSLGTPSIPPPPHPTPSTALSKSQPALFKPKFPRAPVHNPFDKFTQNDFDAWIGKLTGDLEKALGYDDIVSAQDDASLATTTAPRVGSLVAEPTQEFEDDLEGDSTVEDSFAEVKARRVNKGKARDPREGPGLGPKSGDQSQPIEVLSDEEDEQDSDQILGSEGSEEEEAEGEYDEEGYEYDEEDEEEREEVEEVGTSARAKEHWSRKGQADEGEEYDEEYDDEDGEAASVSREGSEEDVIELLSDTESAPRTGKRQQREDEDQFLSDEELADTRSSPVQYDVRSSPAQLDEDAQSEEFYAEKQNEDDVQPSDEDTSFPPYNKSQQTTADALIDIRDPWSQVEKYAEDYYAGGDVIPPRAHKKGLLAAHYLGIKDDDSATGFLSPDVVSNADPENLDEEGEEEEERELRNDDKRDEEEDEDFEEGIEEGTYDDLVDEDSGEQEAEEIDQEVHLFNRLQSSYARRPLGTSYSRGSQLSGLHLKSGPGTNEEPIMIDSDDEDEDAALPSSRPAIPVSVPHRWPGRKLSTERGKTPEEQEEVESYEEGRGQEQEGEGEGDFLDGLVDEVSANEQRRKLIDEFTREKDHNDAQKLGVKDEIEEVPGEPTLDEEVVMDTQADKIELLEGHTNEGVVPSAPFIVDAQTREVAQEPASTARPLSSDSFQNESSAAEVVAQGLFSLGHDVPPSVVSEVQAIQQLVSADLCLPENTVDWTATLNFPASFPLVQQPASLETVGHLEVPDSLPVSIPVTTNESAGSQTTSAANVDSQVFGFEAVADAPYQHMMVHETQVQTVDRRDDHVVVRVEDVEEVEKRESEEDHRSEEESGGKEAIDIDTEVDELDELEEDSDEPGTFLLMTSDLEYPEDEEVEGQDHNLDHPEYEEIQKQEDDALRVSTPSKAIGVETRVEHTAVVEVGLEAAKDDGEGGDREPEVQIFVEEPEEYWEGTPAEITISVHAATPIPPSPSEPMKDKFEELPVSPRPESKSMDETVETDGGMVVDAVLVAASPASREGATVGEAVVVDDDEEEFPTATVEELVMGNITRMPVEEPVVEEPSIISVEEPVTEELLTTFIEELVTVPTSPKDLEQQSVPEDEAADVTITVVKMDASYDVEEPLTASEYYASTGPPSRAVSLGLDLASVRSDEVIPSAEVAIGDVEEIASEVDVESVPEQGEDSAGDHGPFSHHHDGDGSDAEALSISVETHFEVAEAELVVTDVRNLQSTTPPLPELDGEVQIHDHAEEILAIAVEESPIIIEGACATHRLTATPPADDDADGYFAQPGSPAMEHYGSIEMSATPSQANFPRSPSRGGALPTIIQLPGTPQKVLSPGGTLQLGPTPVSIAVDPVVLKALKTNPGLFSPPASIPTSREQDQPSTSSTSAVAGSESVPPEVPARSESIVNAEIVETELGAKLSFDIPQSPAGISVDEPVQEFATNGTPTLQTLQTSFLATTTQGKPALPTLFADPYPYSLSTPGPQNDVERSEEDELAEQENSISVATPTSTSSSSAAAEKPSSSSAARGDRQDEEVVFGHNADNVENRSPPSEITVPTELVAVPTANASVGEALEEVEKGLTDVGLEADKLINEFLVDEPDTDTDADGEADPEFTGAAEENLSEGASEEIMIQETNEEVVSAPRGDGDDATAGVASGEVVEEPMNQEEQEIEPRQPEVQSVEVVEKKYTDLEKEIDRSAAEEENNPFKLMGNDSLAAPKEAKESDAERWEKEESQDEAEVAAFAVPDREPQLESANLLLRPQQAFPLAQVEFSPVEVSLAPLVPQILPPSGSIASSGYVGAVPYHIAATAYVQAQSSPLPLQWADRPATNLLPLNSVLVDPLRRRVSEPATTSTAEQAGGAVSTLVGPSTSDDKSREVTSTNPKLRVDIPRKVQISVEDPYHADNDSDREQGGNALKAKKRKRSQSDVSSPEHPTTPSKVVVSSDKGKGKGKSISSKPVRKLCARRGIDRYRYASFTFLPRSPSVTSTVTSESSIVTQPSPSHVLSASSEPRPFLHAHSRRKRSKAPTTVQEQLQKQRLPSASGSRSGILKAEDVLTKAPSVSSTMASSPVTRSHCRYHKISIPKTENGPRIYFLVPGCCLNDEDLIQEEEIMDDGEAIIQGDTRIVDNIETLDFEAYLHWVLRQLVGPEILRENEVFYLPEPGEEILRNPHRSEKRKAGKPERKRSKLAEEAAENPTMDVNLGQLPSRGSSIASSASVLQQILESEGLSEVTETEEEKLSPTKSGSKTAVDIGEPFTLGEIGSAISRKRSRRLGQDAAAYRPTTDSDEQSSTDFSDYNPTRRGPNRSRGQKRLRSEANVTDGVDVRKTKKPRMQPTQPQVQPSQTQLSQHELLARPPAGFPGPSSPEIPSNTP